MKTKHLFVTLNNTRNSNQNMKTRYKTTSTLKLSEPELFAYAIDIVGQLSHFLVNPEHMHTIESPSTHSIVFS